MTDSKALLKINDLNVEFHQDNTVIQAVSGVSFEIHSGEFVALVGESGSGKSVTAHSIMGLLPPRPRAQRSGEIFFGEERSEDLMTLSEAELCTIRGNQIGMIFQEPMMALNPLHTIYKQIGEIIKLHHPEHTADNVRSEILKLLVEVGITNPELRLFDYPNQLSGGQRQRVMIAMALANKPQLLIADEPTTALDVTIQTQILNLLKSLQESRGMTVLLITHDFNVVKKISDRCLVMHQGTLVEDISTADLFDPKSGPQHPYTQLLIAAEPSGQPLTQPQQRDATVLIADSIEVCFPIYKGVFKRIKDYVRAVDDVSFTLRTGETIGIVGESGSGKSTLAMAILRLIQCRGKITFKGQYLENLQPHQLRPLRKQMQVVFQDPFASLSPRMSIEQIVGEGLTVHFPHLSPEKRANLIITALQEVNIDPSVRNRYPHEFSGGQRQRIAIARAVILQPNILVLDEPTSALDRSVQGQVIDLLKNLQKRHGIAYLFISHDLKVVKTLSHKILVMKAGKVVESGPTEQVFNQPQSAYTQELMKAAF